MAESHSNRPRHYATELAALPIAQRAAAWRAVPAYWHALVRRYVWLQEVCGPTLRANRMAIRIARQAPAARQHALTLLRDQSPSFHAVVRPQVRMFIQYNQRGLSHE